MHEDYVQLKILQTALSLMQSLQVARLEVRHELLYEAVLCTCLHFSPLITMCAT